MPTISVILADAQYLIRKGLHHILSDQPNIHIIGSVADETNLIKLLENHSADVVVMDYNQPDNFTANSIKILKSRFPETGILIISADNEKSSIYEVLEAGVTSFLTKSCDKGEILEGIKAAAKHNRFFCKKVIDYVFERSFAPTEVDLPQPLTSREIEVVQLVAQGRIAKEIASQLNLSTHTIYTHRKNIMRKLKINTASELILYAVNNGLLK